MGSLSITIKPVAYIGTILVWVARVALSLAALTISLLMPPQIDFRAEPLPAVTLSLIGASAVLLPPLLKRRVSSRWPLVVAQVAGFVCLWGVIGWAALSQPAPLNQELALTESLRALPLVALAGLTAFLIVRIGWQRRALLALTLPSLLALSFIASITPSQVLDFRPYWLAVDSRGTLYVSDVESPVIRVFSPDGTLQAKLRPRQAVKRGVPGIGFSPPGPWNDPDNLGVPGLNGQPNQYGWLRPWAPNTDEFLFCGLAVDGQDRLYVLDWLGNQLLRFTPNGWLDAIWPLPRDYQPVTGCLTMSQGRLYIADQGGRVLVYDLSGHLLDTIPLPGQPTGISADGDGHLYALIGNSIWRQTLSTHAVTTWNLPAPRGALGFPYETLLALPHDQVLVSDLNTRKLWRYSGDGRVLGWMGGVGNQAGQFAGISGMALGGDGHLYVTDFDHRVVQRFNAAGTVDGLYRSPDDDEND